MNLRHDSRNPFDRSPGGAVCCGTQLRLRLHVEEPTPPDAVTLRLWDGAEQRIPMESLGVMDGAWLYEASLTLPEKPGLVWYDFRVQKGREQLCYGNAPDQLGGVGMAWGDQPPSYPITVYDANYAAPAWMKDAVVYQIFPDRFARDAKMPAQIPGRQYHGDWEELPALDIEPETGDNRAQDFFCGTLAGIQGKLPYLKDLGITALYLNPIFQANSNHRYDTVDYRQIDPLLGTEKDFQRLCRAGKKAGIRIILDGVFSHTGSESPYFKEAQASQQAPTYGWYTFHTWPHRYESWWGFQTLPEVNEMNPHYQDFMLAKEGVVPHWLKAGAKGWRLDVADELPMDFLRKLRQTAKATDPDCALVGEVWEDASNKVAYGELRSYCLGDTLDSVMNYPLRDALIAFFTGTMDAGDCARRLSALYEHYPAPFAHALMNVLGSHDRPRILNILAGTSGEDLPREERGNLRLNQKQRQRGMALLRLMLQFMATWPGMPTLYYGDEAGLEGAADPFCRKTFPWGREDEALQNYVREQIQRRAEHPVLRRGKAWLLAPHEDLLLTLRCIEEGQDALGQQAENSAALCAINRSGREICFSIPSEMLGHVTLQEDQGQDLRPRNGLYTAAIPPYGGRVWLWQASAQA